MKVSILIVTHLKDFHWLKWCLRSIEKFATGFHEVVVSIPEDTDWKACRDLCNSYRGSTPLRLDTYEDWPGKGFVRHMERIICADQICPDSDYILHMDSDCFFTDQVTPTEYIREGKPVLVHARYDWIVSAFQNENFRYWQTAVENAIGGRPEREAMRRHPAVHYRHVYAATRGMITNHTRRNSGDYIRSTRNEFPQSFCEFATLGEVAWRHYRNDYHWIDQETEGKPAEKLRQCWSYLGPSPEETALMKQLGIA